MKRRSHLIVACAGSLLLGGAAFADCQSELQELTTASGAEAQSGAAETQGISKSGQLAPLEEPAEQDSAATATQDQSAGQDQAASGSGTGHEAEGISKDGSMSPLNSQAERAGIATSPQEVEAQQGGEAPDVGGRAAAIQQARNALAAGDEEACMEAVERAKSL
jgi:hypothetical protein